MVPSEYAMDVPILILVLAWILQVIPSSFVPGTGGCILRTDHVEILGGIT